MRLNGHTILITGGSSGIGLALTERFLTHDNKLIIVGRDTAMTADHRHNGKKISPEDLVNEFVHSLFTFICIQD